MVFKKKIRTKVQKSVFMKKSVQKSVQKRIKKKNLYLYGQIRTSGNTGVWDRTQPPNRCKQNRTLIEGNVIIK